MEQESLDLKQNISQLSDQELLEMVTAHSSEYREEALSFAKAELVTRGIDYTKVDSDEPIDEAIVEPEAISKSESSRVSRALSACPSCGGQLRLGTLVGEKELTIVFADNREERFVRVNACAQCGEISLVADYGTEVQQ